MKIIKTLIIFDQKFTQCNRNFYITKMKKKTIGVHIK